MMRSNCFECCLGAACVMLACCLGTASGAACVPPQRLANRTPGTLHANAICEPLRRQPIDSTASLRTVVETVHNDAVEST
eukprot:984362-Lingulodinium_polyedra.AAC.1